MGLGVDVLVGAYLAGLGSWFALQQMVGDSTWWLFMVNALALYLFVPLPLALIVAGWRRIPALIGGSLVAAGLFFFLWGGLFWPNGSREPDGPVVTVMTYNVLGYNKEAERVVEALRSSDADLIGLQELNPVVASAIERELADEYPYRLLRPQEGVSGSGVISRLPFRPVERDLDTPGWISPPVALAVQLEGSEFLFVQVHNASGAMLFATREHQARLLSDFAAREALPLIVAGDFNASDRNDSYGAKPAADWATRFRARRSRKRRAARGPILLESTCRDG